MKIKLLYLNVILIMAFVLILTFTSCDDKSDSIDTPTLLLKSMDKIEASEDYSYISEANIQYTDFISESAGETSVISEPYIMFTKSISKMGDGYKMQAKVEIKTSELPDLKLGIPALINSPSNIPVTIWIDAKTFIPVKSEIDKSEVLKMYEKDVVKSTETLKITALKPLVKIPVPEYIE